MTRSSVKHLKDQLGRILELAKARENQLSLELKVCEIDAIVEMVDDRGRQLLAEHSATSFTCSRRWDDEAHPKIMSDASKITMILQELVENSFRYKSIHQPNHIEVVFSFQPDMGLEVSIKDTGQGIDKLEFKKILEGFHRLAQDDYAASEGLGVGLSLAYNLTRILAGNFELDSTPGAFTEVKLSFPNLDQALVSQRELEFKAAQAQSKEKSRWRLEEFLKSQGAKTKTVSSLLGKERLDACIYVCEDHQVNRELICQTIEHIGYSFKDFSRAELMLESLRNTGNELPDLILLNLIMPGLSGAECLNKMRKDTRLSSISVILLTARSAREDVLMGLELAVDDYLAKPFTIEELILRIDKVIERQQLYKKDRARTARRSCKCRTKIFAS